MSIATAIQAAQQKVASAYTACDAKGATMPASANQNLSNLATTIGSIPTGGGGPEFPTYTGTVDSVGLAALGWDADDIAWLQAHVWWNAEDNAFWAVSEANLAFGPNGATPLTWANRANIKLNQDVRYFPKFNPSPSSNTSWGYLFSAYTFLVAIPTHGWDTTYVTSLQSAFATCGALRSVGDLSGWNTARVTAINLLFNNCSNLITPGDLSRWNLSACTSMNQAFGYCSSLRTVGSLSAWSTGGATNFQNMFYNCFVLDSLDLSDWDVSNVINLSNMFCACAMLKSVGDLSDWDTGACTNASGMFNGCGCLLSPGDLSDWDTGVCENMSNMFASCTQLTSIGDLSEWDTSACTNMQGMFSGCRFLSSIGDTSDWNTKKVTTMQGMFHTCIALCDLKCSSWDVSKVTTLYQTFYSCLSLPKLDLSGWKLTLCTNVGTTTATSPFAGCYAMQDLILGPHFFDGSPTTYYVQNTTTWTRDSIYESLYTNQTLRDSSSTTITIKLSIYSYDSLSAQDRDDIATKKFTLTRG